jgi:hypothetical protein
MHGEMFSRDDSKGEMFPQSLIRVKPSTPVRIRGSSPPVREGARVDS